MTSKTIDTLIEDIYGLFDSPVEVSDEVLDAFGKRVAEIMKDRLNESREGREPALRLSQIGKHNRKLWYDMRSETQEKINGQTRIKFLYGDLVEEMLLFLAKCAGHTVEDEQLEVDIAGVKGHQDAKIDGVVTDLKSASFFGFKKFQDKSIFSGNDPFGYIGQISAYPQAQGLSESAFWIINKDNAEMLLLKVDSIDMINAEDRVNELKRVVASDEVPDRCYEDVPDGASGNRVLSNDCGWCPHKFTCWSDSNGGNGLRAFEYQERGRVKPKYFTQVSKLPKVPEIIYD